MNAKGIIFLSLSLFGISCIVLATVTTEKPFYFLERGGISRYDPSSKESKVIFKFGEELHHTLSLSPNGKWLSVIKTMRGTMKTWKTPRGSIRGEYETPPRNRLIIVDIEGNLVRTIEDDVRKYSWSPDGNKIAYITGSYYEGGVGFKTTGVWILDLEKDDKHQIEKDFTKLEKRRGKGGYSIYWAPHDNNIYIKDFDYYGGVYRYNPTLKKSENVDYKDISFSPDGQYYLGYIEATIYLYETETGEEITERISPYLNPQAQLASWVPGSNHLMWLTNIQYEGEKGIIKGVKSRTTAMYDPEQNKVVKEISGQVQHWLSMNKGVIPVKRKGKLVFEELPKEYLYPKSEE